MKTLTHTVIPARIIAKALGHKDNKFNKTECMKCHKDISIARFNESAKGFCPKCESEEKEIKEVKNRRR